VTGMSVLLGRATAASIRDGPRQDNRWALTCSFHSLPSQEAQDSCPGGWYNHCSATRWEARDAGANSRGTESTMTERSPAEAIFSAALERATATDRAAFLDEACGGDEGLRHQVERLLAAHPQMGNFLERPVMGPVDLAALAPPGTPEFDAPSDGS